MPLADLPGPRVAGDGKPPPPPSNKTPPLVPRSSHALADSPSSGGTSAPIADQPTPVEGRVVMLPLTKLRIHPCNSRVVRTQERIEEVKAMLEAEHIQREPITVVPGRSDKDRGFFYILSGQTRYHSATLAGWVGLLAQINYDIDPDDHYAFWKASLEHNTSEGESDWDKAVRAKELMAEGITLEQIRIALKKQDDRGVRRILSMTDLPDVVTALVKEHRGKLTAPFCEILKSGLTELGEEVIASVAKLVVEEDWPQRKLQDHLERTKRQKQKMTYGGGKRSTRISMTPIMVGSEKSGELKFLQSRTAGKTLVALTADLPESLVEPFKADMVAALEKLAAANQ